MAVTRGRIVASAAFLLVAVAAVYVALPRLVGLDATRDTLKEGNPWWLLAGLVLEVGSFCGYVVLFRAVIGRQGARLTGSRCAEITMAGVAATRMLAMGGAGGIALTAWALNRSGLPPRRTAAALGAFLVSLYAVFMGSLLLGGSLLYAGILPGPAPWGLTLVPAAFAVLVCALALGLAVVPMELGLRRRSFTRHAGNTLTVAGEAVRAAIEFARAKDPRALGAIAWWGFDVAVLWVSLKAFGTPPGVAVVVMAYFVGMLGNLLPLPGGVGGVDGGMIGALIGFGVPAEQALVGVLAYRAIAFWLPTLPGAVAFLALVRSLRVSSDVSRTVLEATVDPPRTHGA